MTREEELPLVIAAKNGNQQAAEKLLVQYMKMIKDYCRKYKHLDILELDDLEQEAIFFFYDAIRKFDPNKNNKFGTFLYTQLQQLNRVVVYKDFIITRRADYMSRVKKDPEEALRSVSIDQKKNEDGETWADNLVDTNSTPEDRYNSAQTTSIIKDEIMKVLGLYTEAEQKYLIDHFDMYEIIGLNAPSEEPEFEIVNGRRNTIKKTFQNKLKYSKKISRDMLH
jgi:DNA-directed RNA polymerase sigma subunit (sigma70/sigma32)